MKRLLLSSLLVMLFSFGYSQYYYIPFISAGHNPGSLNTDDEYPSGGGLSTTWTELLAGSQTTPAWSNASNIPFPFVFNGDTVTSYRVSSSGVLTFATNYGTAPTGNNTTVPSSLLPDSSVFVWGLAGTGSNDKVMIKNFGTAPNRQHWVFFSSYNVQGGSSSVWTYWSIVLEETTNNIYIVDQRDNGNTLSLTLGLQINSTTAVQVNGSPNINATASSDPSPSDNSYFAFIPGVQPTYDAAVTSSPLSVYLDLTTGPFQIQAKVANYGTAAINSLNLKYSVNGGTAVSTSLSSLNIAMFADQTLTSGTNWNPIQSGIYDIKIWADNINNNNDQNPANDTFFVTVNVLDTIITKRVLVEEGTGAWCGYCVDGAVVMSDILANYPNAIGVTLHNGDAMAFTDGNTVNSTYISGYPQGLVDRYKFPDQGTVALSRSAWMQKTVERLAIPIPVYVSATHTYDMDTRLLNINVMATFHADMTGDFRFNCYLVEDSLVGSGSQWDQVNYYNTTAGHPMYGLGNPIIGYVHNHVTRKMFGGPWGTTGVIPATVTKGSTYNKEYTLVLPQGYRPQHVRLVAFVQKYSTSPNDREILNSNEYELNYHVGMGEVPFVLNSLSVYPNPASGSATLEVDLQNQENVMVSVFNTIGENVYTSTTLMNAGLNEYQLDLNGLSQGIYIVQLRAGEKVYSTKLSVR